MRSLLMTCCGLLVLFSISPMALAERVGRTPPLEILSVERDGDDILVRGRNLATAVYPNSNSATSDRWPSRAQKRR